MVTSLAASGLVTIEQVRAGGCPCIDETITDEQIQAWIDQASDVIAVITGMRIAGQRQVNLRPCRRGIRCGCECCGLDAIPLGDPRPTIDSIYIDGELVDPDNYDLHWQLNGWNLVHLGDGTREPAPWPSYQDLWRADTEDGTFSIYVTYGVDPGAGVIVSAAMELICELAVPNRTANMLQPGITSAQLGGTTITVDSEILDRIRSGALGPQVNYLLGLLAPGGRQQSAVWAPELQMDTWDLRPRPAIALGS